MSKAFPAIQGAVISLALATLILPCASLAESTCGPSTLGAPCAVGGIATQAGTEPELNLGAGNPVHVITGNKYQNEVDLPPSLRAPLLEVSRHYNSLDHRQSVLGQGWALGYDTRVHVIGNRWQIVQADGSRIMFSGLNESSRTNRHGTLTRRGALWFWVWPDKRQLTFDSQGRLIRLIRGPDPATAISLRRHREPGPMQGALHSIIDDNGHGLFFEYFMQHGQAYLRHVTTPAGTFRYHYEFATGLADPSTVSSNLRLRAITRPDGMQRHYLYEAPLQAGNPFHLTGIEIVPADQKRSRRISTWAYDAQGRAVLSVEGNPDSGRNEIHIDYVRTPDTKQEGLTVVRTGHDQATRFRTALQGGRHVLLEVSGMPCPGCAAPGSRARYDTHGRLVQINGMTIRRHNSGHVRQLVPIAPGWPGLALDYNQDGLRTSWRSQSSGTERTVHGSRRQVLRRLFANGDRWDYSYDARGRLTAVNAAKSDDRQETRLSWQEGNLVRIEHANETETRRYDKHKRVVERALVRNVGDSKKRYTERFDYDALNRLVTHHLPEGGTLSYQWGEAQRLLGIVWHDAGGQRRVVIQSQPSEPGYRYGNGLQLTTVLDRGEARQLALRSGQGQLLWLQRQGYDDHGRVHHETHHTAQHAETWRYAYDDSSRLIGAENFVRKDSIPHELHLDVNQDIAANAGTPDAATTTHWYAWNSDGSLAARRTGTTTHKPDIHYDESGLPTRAGARTLHYGPARRLTSVREKGELLATYRYNAFGHRIGKRTATHATDYFYVNNKRVAESDYPPKAASTARITRRYIYAHHVLVGILDYTDETPQGALYAVHADLLGTPRLLTDDKGTIRWFARYSPTGQAEQLAGDMSLAARLPGQFVDAETGWHDNLLRTYLPESGHYLEPDPLGPTPNSQARGYAAQKPRQYVDPLGLLLFAFDGTRNNPETQTNVWKMSQRYLDGPVFYHAGPGNAYRADWDSITAYSASNILDTQWLRLLDALGQPPSEPGETVPIDIIGFSRGAALARHFGNLVNSHIANGQFSYQDERRGLVTACVDLRFMGLFDTVAQFGLGGIRNADYDLSIAPAWGWVAHAVALQEYRRYFPLSSLEGSASLNMVEAPFIGAHADIGGGVSRTQANAGATDEQGDLSDVALNWMLWQARSIALRFDEGPPEQSEITHPIVHDQRSTATRPQGGDRPVDSADGNTLNRYQEEHPRLGRTARQQTEKLIDRYEGWLTDTANEVGTVDMSGYALWLQNELGWRSMPA
ncbi:MAG: hypothetical protein EPN76_02095 [Burkholderiaceae bacterium]|nr:MAG: hypothetical protein EPN76_02095 [Burkholderiaceae bacterium]